MPDSRRASRAPWITAGIAGILFVALVVAFFAVLLPYRRGHAPGAFTSTEKDAIAAASQEATNLLSYRRAHFAADFQRALDGTTGALKTDLEKERATTLKTMTTGKIDLSARVSHQALEGPAEKNSAGAGYVVLVTINGYTSASPTQPVQQQNLKVTVIKVGGKWLANDVTKVDVA